MLFEKCGGETCSFRPSVRVRAIHLPEDMSALCSHAVLVFMPRVLVDKLQLGKYDVLDGRSIGLAGFSRVFPRSWS